MQVIDRDTLTNKAEILYQHTSSGKIIPWSAVRVCEINNIKTVDAEPVRHGQWVKCQGKSNIWYCSECGEKINYKQNRRTYNIPKVPVWQKNKRCRCCGAKMGGAEDA